MENNELRHWGIKGMRWGVRRYQNSDGSLTNAGKKRYNGEMEKSKAETKEERRARLLSTSDPEELYKNRDLLSTAELRERLDRINVERQLGNIAESQKVTAQDRINKVLEVGKTVNDIYEFTNTPVMKALKKKLGLDTGDDDDSKEYNWSKIVKNIDKLSDEDLAKAAKRAENRSKVLTKIDLDEDEDDDD